MTKNALERELSNAVALDIGSQPDVRLFRNNVGEIKDSRGIPVKFGLIPGSADRVGLVAPYGRFLSIEFKRDYKPLTAMQWEHVQAVRKVRGHCACQRCHQGRQEDWMGMVNRFGGVAGIVDNTEDARALVARARMLPIHQETENDDERWFRG